MPAARAYWSGQIRLALVSIPVQVFAATRSTSSISFRQVHKPSGKRVRYEKVVPGLGPVDPDDIVKGYEVEKGKYVLIGEEELEDIRLEAKKTVELVQFVDEADIDPIYYDRPFFVAPEEELAEEAYIVLRNALRDTKKVGLGQIVVRGKSSIVAIRPCGDGLLMEMLRYPEEIRKSNSFFADIPDIEPDSELVDLAKELIERKSSEFKPEAFKDSYTLAVRELIDAKLEKRAPTDVEAPQAEGKVIDLMQALKRSVDKKGSGSKETGSQTSRGSSKAGGKKSASKPRSSGRSSSKSKTKDAA